MIWYSQCEPVWALFYFVNKGQQLRRSTIANKCVSSPKDFVVCMWHILHTLPFDCPVWHNHFSRRMFRIFKRSTPLMEAISLATLWMSVQLQKKRAESKYKCLYTHAHTLLFKSYYFMFLKYVSVILILWNTITI